MEKKKVDYMLVYKTSFNKFQICIKQTMFPDHKTIS